MVQGNVKWFNPTKGFGFIEITSGKDKGTDIFVHSSDVQGRPLRDGDQVEFGIGQDKGNKDRATEVTGGTGDDRDRDDNRRDDRRDDRGRGGNDRYDDRRGDRGGKGMGKGKDRKAGDWDCPECKFVNFASREQCMKCGTEKPQGGGRGRDDSRGRGKGPVKGKGKGGRSDSRRGGGRSRSRSR